MLCVGSVDLWYSYITYWVLKYLHHTFLQNKSHEACYQTLALLMLVGMAT